MSISLMRSECRKFAPNIFNKTKCTNCYRQKEEHSAQALESNRATRKVSKCGYLFVAPGWDFTNPINRTKRWQRRWFMLFDDGELTYSVDEHPETVPQASIDMNKVVEVSDADVETGNRFSLSISSPDGVTYIKGTCREETRWWADVLTVFPRSKSRLKRSTHSSLPPAGPTTQPAQPNQQLNSIHVCSTPSDLRPRFNSCHVDTSGRLHSASSWLSTSEGDSRSGADKATDATVDDDVFPTRDVLDSSTITSLPSTINNSSVEKRKAYRDQPVSSGSPPTRDKISCETKSRTRRVLNREKRGLKTAHSFSEDFANIIPSWRDNSLAPGSRDDADDVTRMLMAEYANECKRDEKLKDIADTLTTPRSHLTSSKTILDRVQPTRDADRTDTKQGKQVRGDPDGCGLDASSQRYSPSSELRVDLPAEDLLNIKKGWLMKQGANKEWNKHWFVLRGAALMYYRDPTSEDKGILDGVVDLSGVKSVNELQVARNYGFQTVAWDDRRCTLSAVTAGIRSNWMAAVRRAAEIPSPNDITMALTLGQKLERKMDNGHQAVICAERERDASLVSGSPIPPLTPLTPRSMLFSSDDEYRTASEGGVRENADWPESLPMSLPPSPPLNRTPISRVKERARSRVCKRSRSSPPTSRRSTLDSVRTEDLVLACCSERPEPDVVLQQSVERRGRELEEMKGQLNVALCEISNAEKEVHRLRQRKSDSGALESQIQELLATLERTEEQLKQRTREASETEALKERYSALLREHEALVSQWQKFDHSEDWRDLYQQVQERYIHDKKVWEQEIDDREASLRDAAGRYEALVRDLSSTQVATEELRRRLSNGIEENESLYQRVHELEGRNAALALSVSRERGRSVESLSELTNVDLDINFDDVDKERLVEEFENLRGRFEKAVGEIRAMKRELRESHAHQDELELMTLALRQEAKQHADGAQAQAQLMAARIEDLTQKLSAAEKQVRALKQKIAKSDSREKRRSLSLKGRESFQICREMEEKLVELEGKVSVLESNGSITCSPGPSTTVISSPSSPSPTPSLNGSSRSSSSRERRRENSLTSSTDGSKKEGLKASSRIRRKSLDSATSSEPMKVLIRLSALESKVANAVANRVEITDKKTTPDRGEESCQGQQVLVSVERVQEEGSSSPGDSELQSRLCRLEHVVYKSRSKMRDCLRLLSKSPASSARRKLIQQEVLGSLEKCVSDLDAILQDAESAGKPVNDEVKSLVTRLELLLQKKLTELLQQRQSLHAAGKLDHPAKMALLAEKLAYETVLIDKMQKAYAPASDCQLGSQVADINRIIEGLETKLTDKEPSKKLGLETCVDYLTRVLSQYLCVQGLLAHPNGRKMCKTDLRLEQKPLPQEILEILNKKKHDLDNAVMRVQAEKLSQLAQCFAWETLNLETDPVGEDRSEKWILNAEDRRIREAWRHAQEAVNHELVQAEISHVMMKCAQSYESLLLGEKEFDMVGGVSKRVSLELWTDAAEQALRREMENAVTQLTGSYEERLSELKRQKSLKKMVNGSATSKEEVRKLLTEFADVTAHKVLVDSKIAVLRGDTVSGCESPHAQTVTVEQGRVLLNGDIASGSLESFSVAEFEFLYLKFLQECNAALGESRDSIQPLEEEPSSGEVMWALSDIRQELNRLQDCIWQGGDAADGAEDIGPGERDRDSGWSWTDVCVQCAALRQQVVSLQNCVMQNQTCQRCQQLQEQMNRLEKLHKDDLINMRVCLEQQVETLTGELEMQRQSLVCQHEMEQAQLKERARKLERRLDTLDSEYSLQMDNLRSAYQETLSAGLDRDLECGDNVRQRYQQEIEHLRTLCEKGLVAMENSHRRIIAELEEKHRQEAEHLRMEKDEALAEETQATLAALDAMRKAHEMEVQKEIAKFKAEFIKKMQASHDIGALHKEHEAEMEEIKKEILSLSEKYSVKCVESAAFEEQLSVLNKQLAQAQQRILDLDARNKQLRAHLVSEANTDSRLLQQQCDAEENLGSGSSSSTLSVNSTNSSVDVPVPKACSVVSSVRKQHANADYYRCRNSCSSLWDKSQCRPSHQPALADSWCLRSKDTKGRSVRSEGYGPSNRQRSEPAVLASAELMRYPRRSCSASLPPLGSPVRPSSPSLSSLSSHSSSPCPLSGMVAERKKLFEQ